MASMLPVLRAASSRAAGVVPAWSLGRTLVLGGVRHASVTKWHQDWQPGPYPVTYEQRAAAAKKYGLLVEDYEPIPEDDFKFCGDYPKLPDVSYYGRDPYYPFDKDEFKHNFGEPYHFDNDAIQEDRFCPEYFNQKGYWPGGWTIKKFFFCHLIGFTTFFCFYYSTTNINWSVPRMYKQFPWDVTQRGVKYYTFELVKEEEE